MIATLVPGLTAVGMALALVVNAGSGGVVDVGVGVGVFVGCTGAGPPLASTMLSKLVDRSRENPTRLCEECLPRRRPLPLGDVAVIG